ncbi:nitrile hydratase subunit alpha [Alphaproteobacteria bacterium]|jgi:hypothetical protein|nr:nitrile hydratase subunit alpha [Alphaproteobacteria bacterium]MDC0395112.1 nitrile hydratase subunit alpha [Alphaproteobacteria bacterium]MDC0461780.1 nitrile hydratase subunit alpha [Alphaproteobacteria bacterium]
MPHDSLKMGPHDVGGETAQPINTADHGMTYWEKFSNGLRIAVSSKGIITLDELRLTAESFGKKYFEMEYFKRNGLALVERCKQRSFFDEAEFQNEIQTQKKNFEVPIVKLPDVKKINHLHDGVEHTHEQSDFQEDEFGEGPPEYYFEMLATAAILRKKNLITEDDIQSRIEKFETVFPFRGVSVIAKAWYDAEFQNYLLKDAKSAIKDMGIHLESFADIICFSQSETTHHVVVCTLCSCYPRTLLGMPPSWYKSRSYRSRVVHEPRKVLEEFGTTIPETKEVKVHDSNADMRYLILPQRPKGTDGWSEKELSELISRDHLVGVRIPKDVIQ